MELSPEQIEAITERLDQLTDLDAADLPGPAAELVDLLSEILEEAEDE